MAPAGAAFHMLWHGLLQVFGKSMYISAIPMINAVLELEETFGLLAVNLYESRH